MIFKSSASLPNLHTPSAGVNSSPNYLESIIARKGELLTKNDTSKNTNYALKYSKNYGIAQHVHRRSGEPYGLALLGNALSLLSSEASGVIMRVLQILAMVQGAIFYKNKEKIRCPPEF